MLFLAVFCGFLAEYQLEHKIEKERGKQYLRSFYEDLKTDTARVSSVINFEDEKLKGLINLNHCYDTISKNITQTSCLLTMIKYSAVNRPFKLTNRTLNQLANAGGFRLLKRNDADSIIAYQQAFEYIDDFQNTVYQDAQDLVRTSFNTVADITTNTQMFKPKEGQLLTTFDEKDVTGKVLFSNDKTLLNKFFNELMLYYRVTYNHKKGLVDLRDTQTRLLKYFRNKYQFD